MAYSPIFALHCDLYGLFGVFVWRTSRNASKDSQNYLEHFTSASSFIRNLLPTVARKVASIAQLQVRSGHVVVISRSHTPLSKHHLHRYLNYWVHSEQRRLRVA